MEPMATWLDDPLLVWKGVAVGRVLLPVGAAIGTVAIVVAEAPEFP